MPRIFVLILGALFALPAFAQTLERPAVKVGDECHSDVYDNLRKDDSKIAERHGVVTSTEGGRITMNWTQKLFVSRDTEDLEEGTYVYDRDIRLIEINGRKYEPFYPSRFYPVTPGAESKDAKVTGGRLDGGTTATTLDGKASDWQKIVVPAGSFDAITIAWDGGYITRLVSGPYANRPISAGTHQEVSLSPRTWCTVQLLSRFNRAGGGVWSERIYKLTSFKN